MDRDRIYEDLTLRNWGYISPQEQTKIRQTKILVAGCGLGSVAAEVALRTGFERLILVDGDTVATHNLNRQIYVLGDVGKNKAISLRKRLRQIHPSSLIEAHPRMLKIGNMGKFVASADLIIDCVDLLDISAILALHEQAKLHGKILISAFPPGWGAAVLVFTPDTPRLQEIAGLNGRVPATYEEFFFGLVQAFHDRIPSYVMDVLRRMIGQLKEGKPCPVPQLGVSTYMTAALISATAVRIVRGQRVPLAPEPLFFDPSMVADNPRVTP